MNYQRVFNGRSNIDLKKILFYMKFLLKKVIIMTLLSVGLKLAFFITVII